MWEDQSAIIELHAKVAEQIKAEEMPPLEEVLERLSEHIGEEEVEEERANSGRNHESYYHQLLNLDLIRLDEQMLRANRNHELSPASLQLLCDKGFRWKEYDELNSILDLPDQTWESRWKHRHPLELRLQLGEGLEITTGRYNRLVREFRRISPEQALVRGRMKFAVEYVIALADRLGGDQRYKELAPRKFTPGEKEKLRSIYQDFGTNDYLAAKTIEKKTKHDIVAANTWVTIRAQQMGIDEKMMRGIVHFARTSADVNTTVYGELYMETIGLWTRSLAKLVGTLQSKAKEYQNMTCLGRTHGQYAQMTTLGHIYANLADQIRQHAEPLLGEDMFRIESTISGAIGTDVDMKAALPQFEPANMYRGIVEDIFGLSFVERGMDQDITNAAISRFLDTMCNVGLVVKKTAVDHWLYASRGIIVKKTKKGESGSSAMPQKANPWLAEGAEALMTKIQNEVISVKEALIAYREQGDLRRSIMRRESFHPIMLSIIALERMNSELNNYEPDQIAMEEEIYKAGPKIVSSAVSNYLRANGVEDAYDVIKGVVMKRKVDAKELEECIYGLRQKGRIDRDTADAVFNMVKPVMDVNGALERVYDGDEIAYEETLIRNTDVKSRRRILGDAVEGTLDMIENATDTIEGLRRYDKAA
ncbi:hypothetical protein KY362_05875 [Candidatus Woesearchaeota archaeon]|nr:hypothetical protein [Candidatus Woesearchaeota archaeon]